MYQNGDCLLNRIGLDAKIIRRFVTLRCCIGIWIKELINKIVVIGGIIYRTKAFAVWLPARTT